MDSQPNRREYFRIDDRIALCMEPVDCVNGEIDHDLFEAHRRELGLVNHLAFNREQHRPQMKKIQVKHPEIGAYLHYLEEALEVLATRIVGAESGLPSVPTHEVNICAEGFSLVTKENRPLGQVVQIRMMLFPSHISLYVLGEVIRCSEITEGDELALGRYETVLRFCQIHDEDREALIKHIHQVQLLQLQQRHEVTD